jgi:phosphatidylserine synthase
MIDALIRPYIAPPLDNAAKKIAQGGISANMLTVIGFALGFVGCFLVGMHTYTAGLLFLLLALLFDGLDGAVARATQSTELGAYLDMMSGVILFAAFPFFFMLSAPEHSMATAILLLTFLMMGMANLAYDYFAMKKGAAPAKSGLVETGEMSVFVVLCCLYPAGFSFFAAALALISLTAAVIRMTLTVKLLKS